MVNYVSFYIILLECMSVFLFLIDILFFGVFLYMSYYYNDKLIRDLFLYLFYILKLYYSYY